MAFLKIIFYVTDYREIFLIIMGGVMLIIYLAYFLQRARPQKQQNPSKINPVHKVTPPPSYEEIAPGIVFKK